MTAPSRSPWFFDSLSGGERTYPDTAREAGWLVDNLAMQARHFSDWRIELDNGCDISVKLELLERSIDPPLARIRASAAGGVVDVLVSTDPAGWALAVAMIDGAEVFRAYIDRPYEEYDLWPSGSTAGPRDEAPGRIGKKMAWVSLSAALWPMLAPLSPQGWFNAAVADPAIAAGPDADSA